MGQGLLFDSAEEGKEQAGNGERRIGIGQGAHGLTPGHNLNEQSETWLQGRLERRSMLVSQWRDMVDDHSGEVGIFAGDLDVEAGNLQEVVGCATTFIGHETLDKLLAPVLHDCEEQALLVDEVVVDRALGVACGKGDLVEPCAGETPVGELRLAGIDQSLPGGCPFACGDPRHVGIMGKSPHKCQGGPMGDAADLETMQEDADFLEHCYRAVLAELGFSPQHAAIVASCVSDGDRNGKLTQGMGVFEIPVLLARTGTMDVAAKPVIVDEGPTWLVIDAQRSSGQWAITMAMEAAIAKAREHAIAIGFVRDFNDAGAFGTYVRMAAREGMMAIATNNSLPLASPWGGMENVLSGAPFAAATPGGDHPPIVTDIQAVEVHDGDLSEAYFQGKRLKGAFLVDPDTGELSDDPEPYFERMEDYGRISDCRAPTVFGTPRMYAFNLFTEMLAGVINPQARMSPEIAGPPSYWLEPRDEALTGGACVIVMDPSHWMPPGEAGARSDRLVDAVKGAKRRPGIDEIFLPGERGWRTMETGAPVQILPAHWDSFVQIVDSVGLTIDGLRESFTP